MATDIPTVKLSSLRLLVASLLGLSSQACGDCAGVGLSRLTPTEQTIHVGEAFVATYEEGGSCSNAFAPVPNRVTWASAETTIVVVDSLTGRVTGKRLGDALVVPSSGVTTGPQSILVHVR
jgi:Bacterial Ig-like domain (group 2)